LGVLSWAKEVIADRGEHAPIPVHLERTEAEEYQFRLGVRAGFGGQETARLPIQHRDNQAPHPILKEIHACEVAGRTLEAANVFALREKVSRALDAIAPARRLPLAYFRVPNMDYELPVYEDDGRIVCPIVAGPKLKARDLAGIRRDIGEYLTSSGYVEEPDQVVVGVLRPRDLRLVPPAAVFRSLADSDFWLPSVEGVSAEGPVLGALVSAARLSEPERRRAGGGPLRQDTAPAAPDVISLLWLIRSELTNRPRRAIDPDSIYASEVQPEIWAAAEARTADAGRRLVAYLTDDEGTRLELVIRRTAAGDVAVALADIYINVFVADDESALASAVGRHLHASGFLRFAEEVEIHAAEPPPAEQLDVEELRTQEPEEVHF
jgi:hypothetical protein